MRAILELATGQADWRIVRTEFGSAGESYLGSGRGRRAVLKFAVLPPGLARLAELGVTPGVIGSGEYGGRPWVLQEHVAGEHPRPAWFGEHLSELAAVLRRYHHDPPLHTLLQGAASVHAQDPDAVAVELEHARRLLSPILPGVADAAYGFDRFEGEMQALDVGSKVPVHPDPNRNNFIVTRDTFFLVDWDGIGLSDRLSDAGLLLWWYVPVGNWPEFFAAYGLDLDQSARTRIYWWTARRSLQVAVWLIERRRQDEGRDFLIDFVAAACHRPNPHWRP